MAKKTAQRSSSRSGRPQGGAARPRQPTRGGGDRASRRRAQRGGGGPSFSGYLPWIAVGVVVAIVIAFVIFKTQSNSGSSASAAGAAPVSVVHAATNVPASTLDQIGAGQGVTPPQLIRGNPPVLTSNGKPQMVYLGGEFCPFCAAQRWAMVVALSRFGTFQNLKVTHSSTSDVYPGTNTFSFAGATYKSPYLVFSPVEAYGPVQGQPLEKPSALQQRLVSQYDRPPYVSSADAGAIPFIDIGNRYLMISSMYSPSVLAGLSWSQIASRLADPSDPVAQAVGGSANVLTAALCNLTHDQPADVCTSSGVKAAGAKLPSGG